MTLQVTNSLTRKLEPFVPLREGKVNMYVCGPTVYGPSHIGHARTYIAFDVIRRYLGYRGYEVNFICNITDVHVDMIKRATERGITIFQLADENIPVYLSDMASLNVQQANGYPRVTEVIPEIIAMVQKLVDKGFAYAVEDGSVYFDVAKLPGYGKLSGVKAEEGVTGTRVETDKYDKAHAQDFALWKGMKPGEPFWESPWGQGRPGWHIECSVMSAKYFGPTFDIHGGAIDLIFPHHENEIAQSEAANDAPFVRYWLHSGLLKINGEKMSKSSGNFIEIPDLLKKYKPMAVRLFLLQSHYKSSPDFTEQGLEEAAKRLGRWKRVLANAKDSVTPATQTDETFRQKFISAMDDDFNSPMALAVIEEVLKSSLSPEVKYKMVMEFDGVLGLQLDAADAAMTDTAKLAEIEALVDERNRLRADKKFAEADAVRARLKNEFNVVIEDKANGVTWRLEQGGK